MNITIEYPDIYVERQFSKPCEERDCQQLAISRFLSGDFVEPMAWDTDAMRQYYRNKQNIRRGRGVVSDSISIINELGDKITWDMVLNEEHTELMVYVFVQYAD